MSKSRVVSVRQQGRFAIVSLSCRHSVKEELAWYERYREYWATMEIECAQCTGFKKKK
jgi:hypothetical protein